MEKVVVKFGKELLLAGLLVVAAVALWVGFDKPAYASSSSDLIIVAADDSGSEVAAEEATPAEKKEMKSEKKEKKEMKKEEPKKEGETAPAAEASPTAGETKKE